VSSSARRLQRVRQRKRERVCAELQVFSSEKSAVGKDYTTKAKQGDSVGLKNKIIEFGST
jgi:hypothetical protein